MNITATDTTAFSPPRRLRVIATAIAAALALVAIAAPSANAAFGIAEFDGEVTANAAGDPATQAGSHPYIAHTDIVFNATTDGLGNTIPDGNFKDLKTVLPAGLVPDPTATPKCTMAEFQAGESALELGECKDSAAVGFSELETGVFGHVSVPVYNLVTPPGKPALFGFHVLSASIFLTGTVRTGGDYGVTIEIPNNSQGLPVTSTSLTFWGVPADPSHDKQRGKCLSLFGPTGSECHSSAEPKPFLTNPTSCTGPVLTSLEANSWQNPGTWSKASFLSHDGGGTPVGAEGCDKLKFEPSFEVQAQPGRAESPSSLSVDIHIPQSDDPDELATAHLKKAVIALPAGVAVNPAAASGLGSCSAAQIGISNANVPSCPNAAKIGTTEIVTPILEEPLKGAVYLAKQGENPFGNLLTIYLAAEAEGIVVKLPGKIETNPTTGQLTATFDNDPQLPFSDLNVDFFGGSGAALLAPSSCGTYSASGSFTPWSGSATVTRSSSFAVTAGPNGGPCPSGKFEPKFSAGTTNPVAGRFSPFVLDLSRADGTGLLTGLDLTLPEGLLGKLAGIPYCPDSALAAIPLAEGTGAVQLASPSCPAASRVGSASVAAGAGPTPVSVETGSVYLAGPYKGAPLSLAIVTPALAGPFDLGNVVVRAALEVDPTTAQVRAVSDPLPTILAGVPLKLRDIHLSLNRDGFTLNPTSCDPMAVSGTVSGSAAASAAVSDRFQVGSCASLGFSPQLTLSLKGATKRNAYPQLRSVLSAKKGQANLGRVSVALPRSEFLAQNHINTVCTRVQFAADACPKGSIYGYAKAVTPLLDKPLEGPVYLRSSDNPLPDLVAALRGQIDIDLAGRIDSSNGGIRTTLPFVPDAPITKFTLEMKGGKKGLLVNSRNLCASVNRATVELDGQNGKVHDSNPILANSCGKTK